jgi:hypothetical protein
MSIDEATKEEWDAAGVKTWYGKRQVPKFDSVNNPHHYNTGKIECIDAIKESMDSHDFKGYLKGNILKYLWRYEYKNGVEDLRKAKWYLDKLIEENL